MEELICARLWFRPVYPTQSLDPGKLRDIRSHQRQVMVQGLPRHEQVIGPNGPADGFEHRAQIAGDPGVGSVEWKNQDWA